MARPTSRPASPAKLDFNGGRDTVVLPTMRASISWSIAAFTIRSGSPSPRSGATFRKMGRPLLARLLDGREQLVERAFVLK